MMIMLMMMMIVLFVLEYDSAETCKDTEVKM